MCLRVHAVVCDGVVDVCILPIWAIWVMVVCECEAWWGPLAVMCLLCTLAVVSPCITLHCVWGHTSEGTSRLLSPLQHPS